jgi:RNA polymerase sigma factor (sigma-70 family)
MDDSPSGCIGSPSGLSGGCGLVARCQGLIFGRVSWLRCRTCAPTPFRSPAIFDRADDLVQETILRALAHSESFTPGTKLTAWLCTILKNAFLTELRKRAREVEDADDAHSARLAERPEQPGRLDL